MYIPHIDKINKYVKLLKDKGYNAIGLWSLNNTKYSMSDEQIRVRNFIIEKEQIPSEYQIVIFNEAYTTGWNLKDETLQKNRVALELLIANCTPTTDDN